MNWVFEMFLVGPADEEDGGGGVERDEAGRRRDVLPARHRVVEIQPEPAPHTTSQHILGRSNYLLVVSV